MKNDLGTRRLIGKARSAPETAPGTIRQAPFFDLHGFDDHPKRCKESGNQCVTVNAVVAARALGRERERERERTVAFHFKYDLRLRQHQSFFRSLPNHFHQQKEVAMAETQ
jgi:hypothetical protein